MQKLALNTGHVTLLDDDDFERARAHRWCFTPSSDGRGGYAHCKGVGYLHRFVLRAEPGVEVDHIDGDRLNNTRANLRRCTSRQNKQNSAVKRNSVSGLKGAQYNPRYGTYSARIRVNGVRINLGTFPDPESAHAAYAKAAVEHFGAFAKF